MMYIPRLSHPSSPRHTSSKEMMSFDECKWQQDTYGAALLGTRCLGAKNKSEDRTKGRIRGWLRTFPYAWTAIRIVNNKERIAEPTREETCGREAGDAQENEVL